jgi:hypothetical protein
MIKISDVIFEFLFGQMADGKRKNDVTSEAMDLVKTRLPSARCLLPPGKLSRFSFSS